MATDYPDAVDSLPRPTAATAMNASGFEGDVVIDNISDAIEAVQTELGTNPAGAYATVVARMDAMEARLAALEPWPEPSVEPIYGVGIGMDTLGNLRIGGPYESRVSMRFRAEQTDLLNSVRWYQLGPGHGFSTGYTDGDGGDIRISIQTDSGGMPSGTMLAYYDHTPGATSDTFPLTTFSSPPSLTAGTVYHVVFDNLDASPTTNFISVDFVLQYNPRPDPLQPKFSKDFAVCYQSATTPAWTEWSGYTPLLQLNYDGGDVQGQSYMQIDISNDRIIEGANNMVREVFTVSGGNKTVSGAYVRVNRTSGTEDLTLTLETSGGTAIDTVTVPAADVQVVSPTASNSSKGVWVGGLFSGGALTLSDATTYRLKLSTGSSTQYWLDQIQQGSAGQGFDQTTLAFGDGYGQYTTNGSTWTDMASQLGDISFYFTRTE